MRFRHLLPLAWGAARVVYILYTYRYNTLTAELLALKHTTPHQPSLSLSSFFLCRLSLSLSPSPPSLSPSVCLCVCVCVSLSPSSSLISTVPSSFTGTWYRCLRCGLNEGGLRTTKGKAEVALQLRLTPRNDFVSQLVAAKLLMREDIGSQARCRIASRYHDTGHTGHEG